MIKVTAHLFPQQHKPYKAGPFFGSAHCWVPCAHSSVWHLTGTGGWVSFANHLIVGHPPLPQILIYHPAFIKYVFDNWLQGHGRYPSTGILSVIFSLHICDEVGRPLPCARLAAGGRELLIA